MFTAIFWKKVWAWIKHYWYWPVILVLLAFSLMSGRSSRKKLFEILEKQKEGYEKEIQIIKEAAEEADKKKTEIFTEHIEEIEKQHNHISIIRKDHNSFTAAATCGMIRSSASYISELKSFCIDNWSPFTSTQSWTPLASVT